jgi:ELWxxDGT repeat protein
MSVDDSNSGGAILMALLILTTIGAHTVWHWIAGSKRSRPRRLQDVAKGRKTGRMRPVAWLAALALSCPLAAPALEARLEADINQLHPRDSDSRPAYFVSAGGVAYFSADDGVHGVELWRTDGTPDSTRMVRDIFPGSPSSGPRDLTELNGQVYFGAADLAHGCALWRSDGSAAGTQPVHVFAPRLLCDFYDGPARFARLGGRLLFSADDGVHGNELWITDGSALGTRLVKDINTDVDPDVGLDGSEPRSFTLLGHRLLFEAYTGRTGEQIWSTDGSEAGTQLVAAVDPFRQPVGDTFVRLRDLLLFEAYTSPGSALWRSDGTAAGTQALVAFDGHVGPLVTLGERVAFFVSDSDSTDLALWSTDGTAAGTSLIVDVPDIDGYGPFDVAATPVGLFFTLGRERQLWISDGTALGTHPVSGREGEVAHHTNELLRFGDGVVFAASDATHGCELWSSDGSASATHLVADIHPSTSACVLYAPPRPLATDASRTRVFFEQSDGAHGYEPYVTDGTAAGTYQLVDINRADTRTLDADARPTISVVVGPHLVFSAADGSGGAQLFATLSSGGIVALSAALDEAAGAALPVEAWSLGDRAIIVARVNEHVYDLWGTDGTPTGTVRLLTSPAGPIELVGSHSDALLLLLPGHELWRSDATALGTQKVVDLDDVHSTRELALDDGLLFISDRGDRREKLWRTDGTADGTALVINLNPTGSDPRPIAEGPIRIGAAAYFSASNGFGRGELWRTDGTPTGTLRLTDSASMSVGRLVAASDRLFFTAYTESSGTQLWATDGSLAGAEQLTQITPSTPAEPLRLFTSFGAALYFAADDGSGLELWRSDGTASGTALLREIAAGPRGAFDVDEATQLDPQLTEVAGRVLFLAADGAHGIGLWRTDGTPNGTEPVAVVNPRPDVLPPAIDLTQIGSRAALFAYSPAGGVEPWISDGTVAGTRQLADVAPGALGSRGRSFWRVNDRLYFFADDGTTGRELHSVAWSALGCPGDCSGDGAVTVNELVRGVGIALGSQPIDQCATLDANADGNVAIDELIAAVLAALGGCVG